MGWRFLHLKLAPRSGGGDDDDDDDDKEEAKQE